MSRLIKTQTDSETRLVCLVTFSQMPSTKVTGRVFQHDVSKITLFLYVFDEHVVFEGQVSSQRSTRAKSAASFYYCTYLASLEWAIFMIKRFLKYMVQSTPTNSHCPRASFGCAYVYTCTIIYISKNMYFSRSSALPDWDCF